MPATRACIPLGLWFGTHARPTLSAPPCITRFHPTRPQDWEKLALDLQTLGFIPPEVDTQQAGLVEPLGRVMSQLVGGGGASKVNIDKVRRQR